LAVSALKLWRASFKNSR